MSKYINPELELLKLIVPPNTPLSPSEKTRLLNNCKTVINNLLDSPLIASLLDTIASLPHESNNIIINEEVTKDIIKILQKS